MKARTDLNVNLWFHLLNEDFQYLIDRYVSFQRVKNVNWYQSGALNVAIWWWINQNWNESSTFRDWKWSIIDLLSSNFMINRSRCEIIRH